jgi:hypothetical protein
MFLTRASARGVRNRVIVGKGNSEARQGSLNRDAGSQLYCPMPDASRARTEMAAKRIAAGL